MNRYTNFSHTVNPSLGSALATGIVGAFLSGAVTAARDIRHMRAGVKTKEQVIENVAKEALGSGLAISAGAVAGNLAKSPLASLATMVAVSIGVKYAYDSIAYDGTCPVAKAAASKTTAMAKDAVSKVKSVAKTTAKKATKAAKKTVSKAKTVTTNNSPVNN